MLDSLSFILTIIRSYWMMLLSFLGGLTLFSRPTPPPANNKYFAHSNNTIHWMEISKTERYGTQLQHQWCAQADADDRSYYREFFSPKTAGSYFPNGEKKWFIGHHWRDHIHEGGLYFYNILMRRSMPAVYAYDLNSPSNTGMRAAYKRVSEKMYPLDEPKKEWKYHNIVISGALIVTICLVVQLFVSLWNITSESRDSLSVPQKTTAISAAETHTPTQSLYAAPTLQNNDKANAEIMRMLNGIAAQQAATNEQIQVIIVKQEQQEASIKQLKRDQRRDQRRRNKR